MGCEKERRYKQGPIYKSIYIYIYIYRMGLWTIAYGSGGPPRVWKEGEDDRKNKEYVMGWKRMKRKERELYFYIYIRNKWTRKDNKRTKKTIKTQRKGWVKSGKQGGEYEATIKTLKWQRKQQ